MMLSLLGRAAKRVVIGREDSSAGPSDTQSMSWRLRETLQRALGNSQYQTVEQREQQEEEEDEGGRRKRRGSWKSREEFYSIDMEEDEVNELFYAKSTRLIDSDGEDEFGTIGRPSEQKTPPYPKAVFYIVTTEFCERFSFYGMKAILTFYLRYRLLYTEDSATVLFHTFSMLCYFTPILGALIADTCLGRYSTIFWMSVLYLIGNAVIALSSVQPWLPELSTQNGVAVFGLLLIAVGTGGIKPCVSAFGGDQFTLPQQEKQLGQFFSVFYFSINAGALLSTLITPVLREDVSCFGGDCYFAAFGLPVILMAVALIVFIMGSSTYVKLRPAGTILTTTIACIWVGAVGKIKSLRGKAPKMSHWLDHARLTFGNEMVEDVRCFTSILFLLLPLPFFWALFDQQGSRWTFQAARLDGSLGATTIHPDQMQMLNPLLILIFVPLMEKCGYPLLSRYGLLTKPLQRVTAGGILAAISFIAAAILESHIVKNSKLHPDGEKLSMLWMIPQYVIITLGEVLFSVSGLQFSFTEAPASMKSMMQACWLLTVSFGNLIVVFVAEASLLPSQTQEFALFSVLMFVDMAVFAFLAYIYQPYKPVKEESSSEGSKDSPAPIGVDGGGSGGPAIQGTDTDGAGRSFSYQELDERFQDAVDSEEEDDVFDSNEVSSQTGK